MGILTTIKCKLVAEQEGQYTVFVFENLDVDYEHINKYITCTKCPNWNYNEKLEIGDIGYLYCDFVTAGTSYYNNSINENSLYKHSNCYFLNFIKEKEKIEIKDFKF